MSSIPREFVESTIVVSPELSYAERNWDDIDDWISDPETYTETDRIISYKLNDIRKRCVRREFKFSKGNPVEYITRFDKPAYRREIKKLLSHDNTVDSFNSILKSFNNTGIVNIDSQTFVNKLISRRKYWLARNIDWSSFPGLLYGEYNDTEFGRKVNQFLLFTMRYQSHRRSRVLQKHRDRINDLAAKVQSNRFYMLGFEQELNEFEEESYDLEMDDELLIVRKKKRPVNYEDMTRLRRDDEYPEAEIIRPRDEKLLQRLKSIINYLENQRRKLMYRIEMAYPTIAQEAKEEEIEMVDIPLNVQPEMMEPEKTEQQQEAGPVVLNAIEGEETTTALDDSSSEFWIKNATSDVLVDQSHASSMEILAMRFKWSSDQPQGTQIFALDMPSRVISSNLNHPAAMLFSQYAYWHGDIRIRIHINTTPFHIGKLIFSWYYAQKFDGNQNHRNNIASSILLPHVCYNASVGEDVVINVPFRNYRSMLCTRKKLIDSLNLYLGTLRCHVFNPLCLTYNTDVDGFVHVSFVNSKFTGISPRMTIQPEMLPMRALVKTAEKTMNVIDKISNLDKPSNIVPPTMYMPQLTDSFATGVNDINQLHSLRLDPSGQIQHPPGSSTGIDETSVNYIIRQWGFLRTVVWTKAMNQGALLFRLPVTPELPYSEYFHTIYNVGDKKVSAAVLPPVSVLASINAFNRGSIEYKFEFINSKYHTGAALVSFTPAASNINLNIAVQSYNATLDIGNTNEYIFKVPYINERPYNPRFNREVSNSVDPYLAPIGEINLFVLNALKVVSTASEAIYINIYIRAGEDFELAVPVSPLYSVNYDGLTTDQDILIRSSWFKGILGLATWRYFDVIAKHGLVLKYGKGDDSILQFDNMKPFVVYEAVFESVMTLPCGFLDNKGQITNMSYRKITHIAMFIVNGDKLNYKYAIGFTTLEKAIEYVETHRAINARDIADSPTVAQWAARYPKTTEFYLASEKDTYSENYDVSVDEFVWRAVYDANIVPNVNEIMCDPTRGYLSSLNSGLRLFGERFTDLKDYCRRYQPYCSTTLNLTRGKIGTVVRIPITPIGLDISNVDNSPLLNIIREGLIPFICSGYRFYRGGLRFKIIVTNLNGTRNEGGDDVFYIQHKPDIIINTRNISTNTITNNLDTALFQTGYAYAALSTSVNNSITVEVPCYIPTNLLMLQKPNFNRLSEVMHYNLGVLDIYCESPSRDEQANYHINVHYSFSDDMDLSAFVGFSPMIDIRSNSKDFNVIQPEADDEKPVKKEEEKPETSQAVVENPKPEGYLTSIKNKITDKVASVSAKFAKEAIRKDLGLPENKEDSIWAIVKDVTAKYGEEYKHVIVSCISQIIHCINNPNLSTFVISVITFLSHIGVECYHLIPKFTKWFKALFSSKVQPEAEDDNKTETSSIEVAKSSIITSLVGASLAVFGKSIDFIKGIKMPNFSNQLFTNIRFGALTINAVITLFTNLFKVIPKIFEFIGSYINPKAWYRWLFFNENALVKSWVKDVEWVLDPNNRVAIHSQVKYNYHIQLLVIVGRDLVNKTQKMVSDNNFKYIYDLNTKLNTIYNEVCLSNTSSGTIGIEPFCFCIHGKSQVGKTFITKEVAAHCLKVIDYETYDHLFYTRPPTTKHWDGVQNEPICIYDDFAHITTDEMLATTIGELLLLKSTATFTPPRAHLNDKGRRYNPLIIAMTMNKPYPKFDQILAETTAWQNRRDVLIHAEFVPPASHPHAQTVQELPEEIQAKMLHAKFSIHRYNSSRDNEDMDEKIQVSVPAINSEGELQKENEEYIMTNTKYMNIHQLKWYLGNQFQRKYAVMRNQYLKEIEQAKSFYPAADKSFETNLDDYRKFIQEHRYNLNSQEKHTLEVVKRLTKNLKCDRCNETANCICDIEMFHTGSIGKLSVKPEGEDEIKVSSKKMTQLEVLIREYQSSNKIFKCAEISDVRDNIITTMTHYNDLAKFQKHAIRDEISKALCTGSINSRLNAYYAYPCIHSMLMLLGSTKSGVFVDYDDKDWYLVYNNEEYPLLLSDCETCRNKLKESEYKKLLRSMIAEQGLRYPLPDYLKEENIKVFKAVTRYTTRLEKSKQAFFEELEKAVAKESWLGKVGSKIYSIIKPLLFIAGIVGGMYMISYGFNMMEDGYDKYLIQKRNRQLLNKAHAEIIKNHDITDECMANNCNICAQMAYDQHRVPKDKKKINISTKQAEMALDVKVSVDRKLRRNYFFLVATTSYGTEVVCRCLGIQSRAFICIDHYIDKIRSLPLDTTLEIRTSQYCRAITMNELSFTKLKNSALVIGLVPRTLPQFTSILNLFASASIVPNINKQAHLYVLDIPVRVNKIENYEVTWYSQNIKLHNDTLYVPHIVSELAPGTNIDFYWSYQTSGKGLCGSVLISDMNISSPLIGIHVAGEVSGGRGYSEVICKDTLENIVNSFDIAVKDVQIEGQMFGDRMIPLNPEVKSVKSALEGDFVFMGTVPTKYAYNPPKESKCIHSLCYNEITQSTYDIPHLHQNDERFEGSPMVNGCMHHTNPPRDFPDELLDIAFDDVQNLILSKVKPLRHIIGPLSVEQSVCGISNIPGYDAMEFDTSEGFPFSSIRPKGAKDKRWLFDLDVDEDGYHLNSINSLVTQTMFEKNQMREQGVIPLTIFTDCLKDLKLPKEKCHKTRIFSISPVDFTIQFRQFFYDYTIAFQKAMLNVESAVGINVDSYEWHDMVQSLLENSERFVCGDYSKFGPRLMTKCVLIAFDIICKWYEHNGDRSSKNKLIRKIMAYETAHAKHLMLNMVYEVMCGAPSGCPITTILNNMVNMLYLRVAYLDIVRSNKNMLITQVKPLNFKLIGEIVALSLVFFRKYIKVYFYGDDLIMTVKSEILPYFNAQQLSYFFSKYDITFTDALKTGNVQLSTSVFANETSFLKRNIRRHDKRPVFVAAMDKRAIEETCNWVFKDHEEPEASIIACESMLLNAFGHGEEYYMMLREKCLSFWREWGEYPRIPTWKEVDWRIYEGNF